MKKNKIRAYMHLVWATWDRLPLIKPEMERRIHRYISDVCADDRCDVLAVGGMEDHVHLLVNLSPTISMADLMKHVKGGSSRFVSEDLCPGEWFQWQGHYGAFSVSARDKEKVISYIGTKRSTIPRERSGRTPRSPAKKSRSQMEVPERCRNGRNEFRRLAADGRVPTGVDTRTTRPCRWRSTLGRQATQPSDFSPTVCARERTSGRADEPETDGIREV